MLRDEIAGLLTENFDLSLLGITDADLDALLRNPNQVEGGAIEGEATGVTPVDLRRQHFGGHCRAAAGRCEASVDGDRS